MVAPVTGPITKSDASALWDHYFNQRRYRQKRPYNLVLDYFVQTSKVVLYYRPGSSVYSVAAKPFGPFNGQTFDNCPETTQAKNLAFERLKGQISDRASMGENLGQLGESVRLIVDKAKVIKDAITRLRRLDVSAFAQWMDKGFIKRNSRFAAAMTLEYNFAIKPSIDDIYSAIDILQKPVPDAPIRGRATVPFSRKFLNPSQGSVNNIWTARVSAEYGASVAISNRNLYLANTLGLINPVQIAWQLLPGSFLFDWLLPVEQFLGHATDLYGLTLTNSYTTYFARGSYYEFWTPYPTIAGTDYRFSVNFAETKRTPGVVLPGLALRPLKTPSLKRAANAVSLAIQAFYK